MYENKKPGRTDSFIRKTTGRDKVISDKGREEIGRLAMSGIAAYMRGEDGRLISIRICDYAWREKEIDWSKTGTTLEEAQKVHAVKVFPSGGGRKSQDMI